MWWPMSVASATMVSILTRKFLGGGLSPTPRRLYVSIASRKYLRGGLSPSPRRLHFFRVSRRGLGGWAKSVVFFRENRRIKIPLKKNPDLAHPPRTLRETLETHIRRGDGLSPPPQKPSRKGQVGLAGEAVGLGRPLGACLGPGKRLCGGLCPSPLRTWFPSLRGSF